MLNNTFRWFSSGLAILALAATVALLIGNGKIQTATDTWKAMSSAAPLLLVGLAFLFAQPIVRPRPIDLMKNLILAGAFLLLGSDLTDAAIYNCKIPRQCRHCALRLGSGMGDASRGGRREEKPKVVNLMR